MLEIIIGYLGNLLINIGDIMTVYILLRFVFGRMDRTDKASIKRMLKIMIPLELIFIALGMWNEIFSLLIFIRYIVLFILLDSKPKLSDIFLSIPILGYSFGIYMIPLGLFNIAYGSLDFLEETSSDKLDAIEWLLALAAVGIMLLMIFVLYRLYKKYPLYFSIDTGKKKTSFYTAMGYGYFILFFAQVGIDMVYKSRFLIFCVLVVLLIMDMVVIIMLVQEYRVKYFTQTAALNEYYLYSQVEQFKNYRIQQRETRRIRHDMQNHLLMLSQLAENGDIESIKNYIGGLSEEMKSTSGELNTGNDTADAIVNAKYAQAAQQGIKIEIDGMLTPQFNVAAIDICTIFANALDNAIEGIPSDCPAEHRIISISISNKNSMNMITFRNPVKPTSTGKLTTTKKDQLNHGFGTENMRRSVQKYNGQLNHRVEGDSNMCYFVLEAVIFC